MDEEVIEVVMLPGGEKSTVTSHHHLPPTVHPHNHPFFHHQQQQQLLHQNQLTNGSTGAESTGDQQEQLRGSKDSGGGNKHFCYQLTHFNGKCFHIFFAIFLLLGKNNYSSDHDFLFWFFAFSSVQPLSADEVAEKEQTPGELGLHSR